MPTKVIIILSEAISLIISVVIWTIDIPPPPILSTLSLYTFLWLASLIVGSALACTFISAWAIDSAVAGKKFVPVKKSMVAILIGTVVMLISGFLFYWVRPDSDNIIILPEVLYFICVGTIAFTAAFGFPLFQAFFRP